MVTIGPMSTQPEPPLSSVDIADELNEKTHTVKVLDGLSLADYVAQPRFNRSVKFYSPTANKAVTASFAIAGSQEPDAKTFLYVGGLVGGRLHALFPDWLLASNNIRGIFVDRAGSGFFTSVGIERRISVWFEAVPLILKDVGVERVALCALSGGVPYAFNLFWERPDLIDPDLPFFIMSPWVHPSKSGVRAHLWMSWIPASMTRSLARLAAAALQRLIAMSYAARETKQKKLDFVGDEARVPAVCGCTAEEVQKHRTFFLQRIFEEDTSGGPEDYILGIKDPKDNWGACADYAVYASKISERAIAETRKVKIMAWFAAKDFIIGDKGIQYFIDTFSNPQLTGLEFSSEVMHGTDHEGVGFPENGVIERMIEAGL